MLVQLDGCCGHLAGNFYLRCWNYGLFVLAQTASVVVHSVDMPLITHQVNNSVLKQQHCHMCRLERQDLPPSSNQCVRQNLKAKFQDS
jgi:hypothetical protein